MELKKNFYYPFAAFLILFMALFVVLSFYSWPSPCDDYDLYLSKVINHGFWGAQVHMFNAWTGRIFNTFLLDLCLYLFPIEFLYKIQAAFTIITYALCVCFLLGILPPPAERIFSKE